MINEASYHYSNSGTHRYNSKEACVDIGYTYKLEAADSSKLYKETGCITSADRLFISWCSLEEVATYLNLLLISQVPQSATV